MTAKLSLSLAIVGLALIVATSLVMFANTGSAASLTSCEKLTMVKDKLTAMDPNHPGLVGVNNALAVQSCPTTNVDCSEGGLSGTCLATESECAGAGGIYFSPTDSCTTGGCCVTF